MYQVAIKAIPNNFYTVSTLNRGYCSVIIFLSKKGVVPQTFVTVCSFDCFCLQIEDPVHTCHSFVVLTNVNVDMFQEVL